MVVSNTGGRSGLQYTVGATAELTDHKGKLLANSDYVAQPFAQSVQ